MMFQYRHLSRHARVFLPLTGLRLSEFDDLSAAMVPVQAATHRDTLAQREKPRKAAKACRGRWRAVSPGASRSAFAGRHLAAALPEA